MLGITLPGFRSCKPLAKAEWKTLGPQAIKETKLIYLISLYFTLLGPEPHQLANDG